MLSKLKELASGAVKGISGQFEKASGAIADLAASPSEDSDAQLRGSDQTHGDRPRDGAN